MAVDFRSLCRTYLFTKKQTIHKNDIVQKKAIIQIPLNICDGLACDVCTNSNAGNTKLDTSPDNNFLESFVNIPCCTHSQPRKISKKTGRQELTTCPTADQIRFIFLKLLK
ncbi:hypothetical protein GAPWK_1351 [Gilliamella apicola]|nr:hypothetical protein GAPWK_1351 [Gilliamella apicola]